MSVELPQSDLIRGMNMATDLTPEQMKQFVKNHFEAFVNQKMRR